MKRLTQAVPSVPKSLDSGFLTEFYEYMKGQGRLASEIDFLSSLSTSHSDLHEDFFTFLRSKEEYQITHAFLINYNTAEYWRNYPLINLIHAGLDINASCKKYNSIPQQLKDDELKQDVLFDLTDDLDEVERAHLPENLQNGERVLIIKNVSEKTGGTHLLGPLENKKLVFQPMSDKRTAFNIIEEYRGYVTEKYSSRKELSYSDNFYNQRLLNTYYIKIDNAVKDVIRTVNKFTERAAVFKSTLDGYSLGAKYLNNECLLYLAHQLVNIDTKSTCKSYTDPLNQAFSTISSLFENEAFMKHYHKKRNYKHLSFKRRELVQRDLLYRKIYLDGKQFENASYIFINTNFPMNGRFEKTVAIFWQSESKYIPESKSAQELQKFHAGYVPKLYIARIITDKLFMRRKTRDIAAVCLAEHMPKKVFETFKNLEGDALKRALQRTQEIFKGIDLLNVTAIEQCWAEMFINLELLKDPAFNNIMVSQRPSSLESIDEKHTEKNNDPITAFYTHCDNSRQRFKLKSQSICHEIAMHEIAMTEIDNKQSVYGLKQADIISKFKFHASCHVKEANLRLRNFPQKMLEAKNFQKLNITQKNTLFKFFAIRDALVSDKSIPGTYLNSLEANFNDDAINRELIKESFSPDKFFKQLDKTFELLKASNPSRVLLHIFTRLQRPLSQYRINAYDKSYKINKIFKPNVWMRLFGFKQEAAVLNSFAQQWRQINQGLPMEQLKARVDELSESITLELSQLKQKGCVGENLFPNSKTLSRVRSYFFKRRLNTIKDKLQALQRALNPDASPEAIQAADTSPVPSHS